MGEGGERKVIESLYIGGQLQGISPAEQFSRLGHLGDCGGDQKGQGSFYQLTAGGDGHQIRCKFQLCTFH